MPSNTSNTSIDNHHQQRASDSSDREKQYASLIPQIDSLIAGESNHTGVLANVTAALRTAFGDRFFWVGFYLAEDQELLLGPFQGTVACFRIGYGRGVCGTAWAQGKTIVVDDVEEFPGHIACSSLSRSEIVVPLYDSNGDIAGVLDIDSTDLAAFDAADQKGLEAICRLLTPLFPSQNGKTTTP